MTLIAGLVTGAAAGALLLLSFVEVFGSVDDRVSAATPHAVRPWGSTMILCYTPRATIYSLWSQSGVCSASPALLRLV